MFRAYHARNMYRTINKYIERNLCVKLDKYQESFLIIATNFEIIKQTNLCVISYYENCQDDFYNAWYRGRLTSLALSYLSLTERRKLAIGFVNSVWGSLKLSEYSDFQPCVFTRTEYQQFTCHK